MKDSETAPFVGGALKVYARQAYAEGAGIADIMSETGKDYETIRVALGEAGVSLLTGGPHDTTTCRHDHRLAFEHAAGRCQHPVKVRKYNAKERQLIAVFGRDRSKWPTSATTPQGA